MSTTPDIETALARIAELNRALGLDPDKDPVLAASRGISMQQPQETLSSDPAVASAAWDMIRYMTSKIIEIEGKKKSVQRGMDQNIRILNNARDDEMKRQAQEYIDADKPEYDESMAAFDRHIDVLRSKIERLESDPMSMFLPLGTVVRFNDVPSYPNSLGLLRNTPDKQYPVPGTVGVVTGLNHRDEYPIRVSVRREFNDGYGYTFYPEYDRMPTYLVDPEKLEVVEPGLLPGGVPCESYGYVATHARHKERIGNERQDEMVVEADGFFWRLHDFGDTRGIEALQAYEDIEEMSWISGPLVDDTKPAPSM